MLEETVTNQIDLFVPPKKQIFKDKTYQVWQTPASSTFWYRTANNQLITGVMHKRISSMEELSDMVVEFVYSRSFPLKY